MDIDQIACEIEAGIKQHSDKPMEAAYEVAPKLISFIENLTVEDAIDLIIVLRNRRIARKRGVRFSNDKRS